GATFADASGLKANATVSLAVSFKPQIIDIPVGTDNPRCAQSALVTSLLNLQAALAPQRPAVPEARAIADELELMRARAKDGPTPEVASMRTSVAKGAALLADILSSPTIVASPRRFWMAVAQVPDLVCLHFVTQISAGLEATHHSIDYL